MCFVKALCNMSKCYDEVHLYLFMSRGRQEGLRVPDSLHSEREGISDSSLEKLGHETCVV